MSTTCFGHSELSLFNQAVSLAEDAVSSHYQLSEASWRDYCHEWRTLADLLPQEISPQALAQILRLYAPPRPGALRGKDFYRICLQDHNLLKIIGCRGISDLFLPMLVYIATHELIHVVRFYKFLHPFDASDSQRDREEQLVHALTGKILKTIPLSGLDRVLNFYDVSSDALGSA